MSDDQPVPPISMDTTYGEPLLDDVVTDDDGLPLVDDADELLI